MNNRLRNDLIILGLCTALVALSVFVSAASSSLLSPGTSRTTAGSSFDFTLDLSDVIKAAKDSEEEGDVLTDFDVSLSVSPSVTAFSVSEGVGSVNAVTGEYHVSSSGLKGNKSLHFSVATPADLSKDTTYTVSVSITGLEEKVSDSFTFVVVPVKTEKTDDPKNANNKKGFSLPGKGKSGGISISGGASGGSTASVVYAGSWDNYLDSLSVEGFEFTRNFNKIRDTYFLTVPLDTTELTVDAKASDSSAIVAVTGNTELPEGRSKIMINVTADDGSVRIYRIYVDRVDTAGSANSTDNSEGSTTEDANEGKIEI